MFGSFRLKPVSYPHLLFFSGWTSGSKQEAAAEIFVSDACVSLLQQRSISLLQLLHIQPALQLQTTHTHPYPHACMHAHAHTHTHTHTHKHTHTNLNVEHKSSHKQHRYICSNIQQYIVWIKMIHFYLMPKIIRILRSCSMKIFVP